MHIGEILNGNCENLMVRQFPPADRLIFAFSHVGYPTGSFAMKNVFADASLHANVVFVNCKDNAWYQCGINDEYNSIEKSAELFNQLLEHFAPSRSLTVGMSMGGYAAVLFGLLLQVDYVTTFTPELILGLPYCRSVALNNVRTFDFRYISLQHLLAINQHTVVNAIYGAYDLIDLSLLWPVSHLLGADQGRLRVTFCSEGHQVPLSLDVGNLVRSTFAVGRLEPRDIRAGIVLRTKHTAVELYAFARAMHLKDSGDFSGVHSVLTSESSFRHISWIAFFLAENFADLGEIDRAIELFLRTTALDPTSYYAWSRLAQFAEGMSRFDVASHACEAALSIKPGDLHVSKLLGKLRVNGHLRDVDIKDGGAVA
jgi:tetratricopeptide (TPR) repeat protein